MAKTVKNGDSVIVRVEGVDVTATVVATADDGRVIAQWSSDGQEHLSHLIQHDPTHHRLSYRFPSEPAK